MLRALLRSLLKDLLIAVVLLVASATLPFAAFPLCRDPVGAQVVFWLGPWTCAVWTLLASVLVGSRVWLGRERVLARRAARGGYVRSSQGDRVDILRLAWIIRLRVRRHPPCAPVSDCDGSFPVCDLFPGAARAPVERSPWLRSSPRAGSQAKGDEAVIATFAAQMTRWEF